MSNIQSIAILGLFSLLVIGGLMSKVGSKCGRGWLAFLMLPLAAASAYLLVNQYIAKSASTEAAAAEGVAEGSGKGKVASFLSGDGSSRSLIGYAIFLAFAQYVMTSIFTMVHKSEVNKFTVLQKSFVAAAISFIISMITIFGLKAVTKPALGLISRVPVIGNFLNKGMIYGLALSPPLIIGALAAHGISCSMTK